MVLDQSFTAYCCDLSDPHSSAALHLIATGCNCYVPIVVIHTICHLTVLNEQQKSLTPYPLLTAWVRDELFVTQLL